MLLISFYPILIAKLHNESMNPGEHKTYRKDTFPFNQLTPNKAITPYRDP